MGKILKDSYCDLSVVIPLHYGNSFNIVFFIKLLESIQSQKLKPKEVIVSDDSQGKLDESFLNYIYSNFNFKIKYFHNITERGISQNTNYGLKKANGKYVHVMHQDDHILTNFFYLEVMSAFSQSRSKWVISPSVDSYRSIQPKITELLILGINDIGSPSNIVFTRDNKSNLFDVRLSMLTDVEFYTKLYNSYGAPEILKNTNVFTNVGSHQSQKLIDESEILAELDIINNQYTIDSQNIIKSLKLYNYQPIHSVLLKYAYLNHYISRHFFLRIYIYSKLRSFIKSNRITYQMGIKVKRNLIRFQRNLDI